MAEGSGWGIAQYRFDPGPYVEAAAEALYDTYSELAGDPEDDRWVNLPERRRELWRYMVRESIGAFLPKLVGDVVAHIGRGVGVEVLDVVTEEPGGDTE